MGQRLGQHFLIDESVLDGIKSRILDLKEMYALDQCIEIGPGQGALTEYLVGDFSKYLAIEMDEKMQSKMNAYKKRFNGFSVLRGDILQISYEKIESVQKMKDSILVGNLPYYITSPIFRKFFVDAITHTAGVFLIQKEVGEKLKSDASKKSFLWWLVNYRYTVSYEFTVPPEAFNPPPRVDSAVISFTRHNNDRSVSLKELLVFLDVVNQFSRKTLGKIQKMRKNVFEENGWSVPEEIQGKRLEELSWEALEKIILYKA